MLATCQVLPSCQAPFRPSFRSVQYAWIDNMHQTDVFEVVYVYSPPCTHAFGVPKQ